MNSRIRPRLPVLWVVGVPLLVRCAMERVSYIAAALAIVLVVPIPVDAAPFTIGANFTGTDLTALATAFPGYECCIPPDTMGAVGPNHIGEILNTSFAVYDKTGVLQTRVKLPDFWSNAFANAGTVATIRGPFDPRLLYDPSSSRWFAVSADMELSSRAGSQLFVGVTMGSDPSLPNWRGFVIDADSNNTHWTDFPTIGLDNTALYISNNMFRVSNDAFDKVTLVGVPKSSLTAAAPSIAGFRKEEEFIWTYAGFRMQPAVDLDGGSSPLETIGPISDSHIRRSMIPADWITGASNFLPGNLLAYPQSTPPLAHQPGPDDNIHTGGSSAFSANVVKQNGSLWAVNPTNVGGRAAISFLEMDGTSATPSIRQKITLSDPSLDLYYPSVAVNERGDVVIGFSGSDDNTPISTYAVVGTTTNGVTAFGPITQTHAGTGEYLIFLDQYGRNRWGDYSATVLDPSKPRTFWTFQEYVNGDMAVEPFFDNWAIRVTEITIVPEPSGWCLGALLGIVFLQRRQKTLEQTRFSRSMAI